MPAEDLRKYRPAVFLTFALFALWGIGHRLYDTLMPEFTSVFAFDFGQLILSQSLYSLVYLVFAIPAALYSRTFGSKATIVFGLGCWAIGAFLFYPAVQQHAFGFFLFSASVMAVGYINLEIGANPLIVGMGPPETTVRRLNFAHACYPLGAFVGLYVGRWMILSDRVLPIDGFTNAVVLPYMVLGAGVLLLAFVIDKVAFPAIATERGGHRHIGGEIRQLLLRPRFLAAVGAMACAAATRMATWALSVVYVEKNLPGVSQIVAADYLLAGLAMYAIGRWLGAFLMFRFDPLKLLAVFAASGVVCGLIATIWGGAIGVYAVVASNFSISIAFATVLGTAIKDLGPLIKTGTALLYMGSSGVAVGLVAMHLIWSVWSLQTAMIVPTLGFAGILAFALTCCRAKTSSAVCAAA